MIHFLQEINSIKMIDIRKEKVSISCPDCKGSIKVTIEQVSKQELVRCTCGQDIQLVDDKGSNRKPIKDINKSFKGLEKTFKKFGK